MEYSHVYGIKKDGNSDHSVKMTVVPGFQVKNLVTLSFVRKQCKNYSEKNINNDKFQIHIFSNIVRRMGMLSLAASLGAFREEQAMSQHLVSPSPFLSSSSLTTQSHYTNSYTYSHPNLIFLQYTIQILFPHVTWSAQAMRDSKIDHTKHHLSALCGTRST